MLKVVDLIHHLPRANPNDEPLLSIANCTINAGESVAIVGASGSGKTTLLSFLAGLDTPVKGQVLIAGQDITTLNEEARACVRAEQVAFVFQNFQLIYGLTAMQNVCLPLEVKGVTRPEPEAKQWLERVGLGHRLDHKPTQLSGGEQQRVALARAFACGAPLLFADEPTGSLDTKTGQAIADLLFELCSNKAPTNTAQGDQILTEQDHANQPHVNTDPAPKAQTLAQTLVLVTHDLNLAQRCDRVLTLTNGQLVESPKREPSPQSQQGASL